MTVPRPDNGPFSSYYEAMSYNFGNYKVLLGCEVDAIDEEGHSVELKTAKIHDLCDPYFLDRDRAHKRDVWLQMKLSGTKTLYLGKVQFPDRELNHGDPANVTVERYDVDDLKVLGGFSDADERLAFAKVEELLAWIKKELPFDGGRRLAILTYTKEVAGQRAESVRYAKPATLATRWNPAKPAVPFRAAQAEIKHVEASLSLTVQEFSQDASTISEDLFNTLNQYL